MCWIAKKRLSKVFLFATFIALTTGCTMGGTIRTVTSSFDAKETLVGDTSGTRNNIGIRLIHDKSRDPDQSILSVTIRSDQPIENSNSFQIKVKDQVISLSSTEKTLFSTETSILKVDRTTSNVQNVTFATKDYSVNLNTLKLIAKSGYEMRVNTERGSVEDMLIFGKYVFVDFVKEIDKLSSPDK